MRCLFCKEDSSDTKSIEHIIPESLGNKTLTLPKGYVCDKCNNYFARKVEKPFMELPAIKYLRFQQLVPNKRNRIPEVDGFYNGNDRVTLGAELKDDGYFNYVNVSDKVFKDILNNKKGCIIFPAITDDTEMKNNRIVSRLLAKMALESLANILKDIPGSLDELIDMKEFDLIRNHARIGMPSEWPCSIRRIYSINQYRKGDNNTWEQIVHESDFLILDQGGNEDYRYVIMYYVVAIWGMEFVINMSQPEINGYYKWLSDNHLVSPLYSGKNVDK